MTHSLMQFDHRFLYMSEWFIEDPPYHWNCRCELGV